MSWARKQPSAATLRGPQNNIFFNQDPETMSFGENRLVSTTSSSNNQNVQPEKVISPGPEPKGTKKHLNVTTANGTTYGVNVTKKGGTRRNKKRSKKRHTRNKRLRRN